MTRTTLTHYRITAKLGEGGMGAVYRAIDTKLDREVVITVLPAFFAQDKERVASFEREAKALAALNRPDIACIRGDTPIPGTCPAQVLPLIHNVSTMTRFLDAVERREGRGAELLELRGDGRLS